MYLKFVSNKQVFRKIGDQIFKFYLFDFFCSGIQFYVPVLLSPYLCFIYVLYLDLFVLGDDAWTS